MFGNVRPGSILVQHEVGLFLLPKQDTVPAMTLGRVLIGVSILLSVDLDLQKLHYLVWRDGSELALCPFVPRCKILTMNMRHQCLHFIMVLLHLGLFY